MQMGRQANQRQQMLQLAHLPIRTRVEIALKDIATNLATTYASAGLPRQPIDEFFIKWMHELHVINTPAQQIIRRATQQAQFLKEKVDTAIKGQPPHKRGRRKQYVTTTEQPNMLRLMSVRAEAIEKWRLTLAAFLPQARAYKRGRNPEFQIKLKRWVGEFVWKHISQRLLQAHHRTKQREPTNDQAVANFLMRRGQYAAPQQFTASTYRHRPLAAQTVQEALNTAIDEELIHRYRPQQRDDEEPQMQILTSASIMQIRQWQRDFEIFVHRAASYRREHDPNFSIDLRAYVHTDTWNYISENLIQQEQRTIEGTPANDQEVENFLLRRRNYAPPTKMTARKRQTPQADRYQTQKTNTTDSSAGNTTEQTNRASSSTSSAEETSLSAGKATDTATSDSDNTASPSSITSESESDDYNNDSTDDSGADENTHL